MPEQEREHFWIGSEVVCPQCGHHNVLTDAFPVVVLKRTRTQGVVSIGFACEQCGARHIVKQDRLPLQPTAGNGRRTRRRTTPPSS